MLHTDGQVVSVGLYLRESQVLHADSHVVSVGLYLWESHVPHADGQVVLSDYTCEKATCCMRIFRWFR